MGHDETLTGLNATTAVEAPRGSSARKASRSTCPEATVVHAQANIPGSSEGGRRNKFTKESQGNERGPGLPRCKCTGHEC